MGADALSDDADALLALAEARSLTAVQARERMRRVVGAVSEWKEQARNHGIREQEIVTMAESIQPRLEGVLTALSTGGGSAH